MIDGGRFPLLSAAPVTAAVGGSGGDEHANGAGDDAAAASFGDGNVDGERQLWCTVIDGSFVRTGAKCNRSS